MKAIFMLLIAMVGNHKAIVWPFTGVQQMWRDYKAGRALRQKEAKGLQGVDKGITTSEERLQCQYKRPSPSCEGGHGITAPHCEAPAHGGWQRSRTNEFPWRFEHVVKEESNWRGTWVLEVKDLLAMNWRSERCSQENGRG